VKLRPYQEEQLGAIASTFFDKNLNRLLVKSPTGTGKTVTFAEIMKWDRIRAWLDTFPANERRMLVIAHREELLDQAAAKIRAANPGLLVGVEQGERRASTSLDVVVASIQTLAAMKFRRLERLTKSMRFRVVIVDEAHHAAARTYRATLARLGFLPAMPDDGADNIDRVEETDVAAMEQALKGWDRIAARDQLLVGVTATPNRSDAVGLGCVFQTIAYSYALKDAISDGWLVPIVPWAIETDTSLDGVRIARGEFNQRELADAVNTDERNQRAVAAWREHAAGLPTIAFTVDVAHAHALAAEFDKAGYRAAAVSGETPKDERRAILERFSAGGLDVVTNCMVLTEGTDLPIAACILHAKPTKSATLYEQMTGRGLRLFPGKAECVVIDLVDVARRHSLQTAPVLYGLPPGLIPKGEKLDQLEDEYAALIKEFEAFDSSKAFEDGAHLTLEQLRAKAQLVDIWKVPDLGAFGTGRAMTWLKVSDDEFRMEYPWQDAAGVKGHERIEVRKDYLDRWEVVLTFTERLEKGEKRRAERRQSTIANQILTSDAAAGVAEGFVLQHRRAVTRLASNDAAWRTEEPSPKQLGLLKRLRIPHAANISKGDASKLIGLYMSRQGPRAR
jgi:superfamily II DNA or RNA helicase